MRRILVAATLFVLALLLPGCASEEAPRPPDVERRDEAVHELPELPRGFEPYLSRANGLMLGRPPGWEARTRGITTLLEAPDRLVAMSLSADRTNEAIAVDPRTFALRAFESLPGYQGELDPSEPERFGHRYEAYSVEGNGVAAESGVRQRIRLVVLRRAGAVVITGVIAENAGHGAPAEVRQALAALRTLRTRPVG